MRLLRLIIPIVRIHFARVSHTLIINAWRKGDEARVRVSPYSEPAAIAFPSPPFKSQHLPFIFPGNINHTARIGYRPRSHRPRRGEANNDIRFPSPILLRLPSSSSFVSKEETTLSRSVFLPARPSKAICGQTVFFHG